MTRGIRPRLMSSPARFTKVSCTEDKHVSKEKAMVMLTVYQQEKDIYNVPDSHLWQRCRPCCLCELGAWSELLWWPLLPPPLRTESVKRKKTQVIINGALSCVFLVLKEWYSPSIALGKILRDHFTFFLSLKKKSWEGQFWVRNRRVKFAVAS